MAVDLHTHSCCSDGSLTPSELMELAYEKKLSAIALTDHDTVSGIKEAKKVAEDLSITLIPGIEISRKKRENAESNQRKRLQY